MELEEQPKYRPLLATLKVGMATFVAKLDQQVLLFLAFVNNLFIFSGQLAGFWSLLKSKVATKNRPRTYIFSQIGQMATFFLIKD